MLLLVQYTLIFDSAQISDLISSLIIYLCGFVLFFKTTLTAWLDRRAERRMAEDRKGGEK